MKGWFVMKKIYDYPKLQVTKFKNNDVISLSGVNTQDDGYAAALGEGTLKSTKGYKNLKS